MVRTDGERQDVSALTLCASEPGRTPCLTVAMEYKTTRNVCKLSSEGQNSYVLDGFFQDATHSIVGTFLLPSPTGPVDYFPF